METSAVLPIDPSTAHKLLSSSGTFATTLNIILLKTFKEEAYELEPAELFNQLESTYNVKLPQEVEDRINAILTLMLTDAFYSDPTACRAITLAFVDGDPGFELLQSDPERHEVLWAAYEASLSRLGPALTPAVIAWIDELEANHGWDAHTTPDDPSEELEVAAWLADQEQALAAQLLQLGVGPQDRPTFQSYLESLPGLVPA